eukprot:11970226-Ditylum_brightwellii.AAC.1
MIITNTPQNTENLGKDKAKHHLRQIGCFNRLRFSMPYMLLLVAYFSLASARNLEQNAQLKPMWMTLTIQHITQTWENLLYGTGGELSLKKTHWWLLTWIWEGGKACLVTRGELPETMKITVGCSDTPSTVQRKEVNDS